MAAPRERQRALQTGRAGTHDQHRLATLASRHPLGMPAAAPLLHDGRVLRAPHGGEAVLAGHADVAADALADLVEAALLDLLGQERVGDGRARRADEVDDAPPHLREHGFGRGEPADPDHRLRGHGLDERHVRLLVPFPREPGGGGVEGPVVEVDVP